MTWIFDKILYINSILSMCLRLPASHRQAYEVFLATLQEMQGMAVMPVDRERLKQGFKRVVEVGDRLIIPLTESGLAPEAIARWQAIQTEIKRSLRLLQVDVMMSMSARQAATSQSRIQGISDRLQTLIGYCQALLG